mgnify:CR=1 FL=1
MNPAASGSVAARCPRCSAPLPPGAPPGICPQCELQGALEVLSAPVAEGATGGPVVGTGPPGASPCQFGDYELLEEIARGLHLVHHLQVDGLARLEIQLDAHRVTVIGQYDSCGAVSSGSARIPLP